MGDAQWQEAPNEQDAIRIFRGDLPPVAGAGGRGALSPRMTLSAFFESYVVPVHLVTHDAAPRYTEELRGSVALWVRFARDPPLSEIDAWHARDFVAGLKSLPGRKSPTASNNTVRKHVGHVQSILDLCGQPDRRSREAVGLLDVVPFIPRPRREEKPAEDCYALAELVALCENAERARLPDKLPCSAATYHRRIYTLIFNTGMRIGGVMGASWRHYHGDHLWLQPRVAAKGIRGQRVELNAQAREVIEAMRGAGAERIFPWPRKWPDSRSSLYGQHDLVRQCLPVDRRDFLAYHALRKLHNNELAAINGLACMKSLGHSTGRTTVENYTSRSVVAAAVAQLRPVPAAAGRQMRLFD